MKLDLDTTIVLGLSLAIWVFIFQYSGMFRLLKVHPIIMGVFVTFIVYSIANLLTSGHTSGGVVYELNILLTVEQMISILLGSFLLLCLFLYKLQAPEPLRPLLTRLSVIIVLLLACASAWVNIISSGRTFRALRKFKQSLYNIALALFAIICILLLESNVIV